MWAIGIFKINIDNEKPILLEETIREIDLEYYISIAKHLDELLKPFNGKIFLSNIQTFKSIGSTYITYYFYAKKTKNINSILYKKIIGNIGLWQLGIVLILNKSKDDVIKSIYGEFTDNDIMNTNIDISKTLYEDKKLKDFALSYALINDWV